MQSTDPRPPVPVELQAEQDTRPAPADEPAAVHANNPLARTLDALSTALSPGASDPGAIEYASWIRLLNTRSA